MQARQFYALLRAVCEPDLRGGFRRSAADVEYRDLPIDFDQEWIANAFRGTGADARGLVSRDYAQNKTRIARAPKKGK